LPLPSNDLKLLKAILECGHALERQWPEASDQLELLRGKIAELKSRAESEDLRRLAFHSENLTESMTARHLAGILVPFERLQGRALRDDEILVHELDRPEASRQTAPLTVIADNIRSAFNIGAILRTSEAFGAEQVLLSGYSSSPDEERTAKTSLGAEHHISWKRVESGKEALKTMKASGYRIVALETAEGAEDLGSFEWPQRCALLLGNERFGVDHDLLAEADHVLRIPLHGRKNSLNVGIALGVALADWRRQLADRVEPDKAEPGLRPIGVFRSESVHPYEARRQGAVDDSSQTTWIDLDKGRQFEQALEDLGGFERIWLLYRFHHNENWKPKVMPPRGPRTKRGVFATRSPYRPNPLGLSCVELVKIEGLRVYVRGADLLDGTPIFDIKPYLAYADSFPAAKAGWTEGLKESAHDVVFQAQSEDKLRWLEARGVTQLRGFLQAQLEYDPLDADRKRVADSPLSSEGTKLHRISYRTWRADFLISGKDVRVVDLSSGYTTDELQASDDPYSDKALHRTFCEKFPLTYAGT
jgi:tRNA (adenine37-N6)-methyltransferase